MTFEEGQRVTVTDPDGARWNGVVLCPSALWDGWYVVQIDRIGKHLGKRSNHTVHQDEMAKRR